jgi:hypothetical protein
VDRSRPANNRRDLHYHLVRVRKTWTADCLILNVSVGKLLRSEEKRNQRRTLTSRPFALLGDPRIGVRSFASAYLQIGQISAVAR